MNKFDLQRTQTVFRVNFDRDQGPPNELIIFSTLSHQVRSFAELLKSDAGSRPVEARIKALPAAVLSEDAESLTGA
jgi:hypothetical protein